MELIEALQRLDPNNDDHWTASGEPAVAAVSELVGRQVTRAEITRAAPDFGRPELRDPRDVNDGGDAEGSGDKTGPETSDAPPASDPRDEGDGEGDLREDAPDVVEMAELAGAPDYDPSRHGPQDPAERKAWLQGMMTRLGAGIRRGQETLQRMSNEFAALDKQAPEPTPDERFKADRAHFQATQAALREQRAERLAALKASNVDIGQIAAIVHPSKLDAAMGRRNQRGNRRPEMIPGSSSVKQPATGS